MATSDLHLKLEIPSEPLMIPPSSPTVSNTFIVFDIPSGGMPDTRLRVFQITFAAHSACLRANSKFFNAFLDSQDKVASNPVSFEPEDVNRFLKYRYVTVIDEDGEGWGLEAESKVRRPPQQQKHLVHQQPGKTTAS
jgi:hypothetical protein